MHYLRGAIDEKEIFSHVYDNRGAYVFYRPVGGIGDAVMMLPAITAFKEQAGDELVGVSCVDYIRPIFEHNSHVDFIISYTQNEIGRSEDFHGLGILQDMGSVIFKYYHPCPAAIYEAEVNPLIVRSRQDIFCDVCGVEFDVDNYDFIISNRDEEIFEKEGLPNYYIVVQMRSHDEWRNYRFVDWLLIELVKFGRKHGIEIVTIDATMVSSVDGVKSIAKINLDRVFTIINHAALVVSHDSSFAHIAGALGVPVLALFGPTDPAVRLKYNNMNWLPRFKRCPIQYCWYTPCKFRFCLSAYRVRPKKVIGYIKKILNGGRVGYEN